MKKYKIPLKILNVEELYVKAYKRSYKQVLISDKLLSAFSQTSIVIEEYYRTINKEELTFEQTKRARKFFIEYTSHEILLKITYFQYNPNFFSKFYYKLKQLIIQLCNKDNI